ncbi:MAG TPA: UTP--glucose-1-phosphate uridylyltransferase GalU [Bacteriovoracaceae bacterium]|nr:UTP--glucose-1-phosphate uridylyltransferase GalU [Bacteriovoracaceae bacterium]
MKIRKAIIPIAGKGTRFLPATKEIAKEILPIINVPMIHYVVQEAVDAGIEQIIFVTSSGKSSVENYFDRNLELENFLEKNNKLKELETIRKIGSMVSITTVRQKEQLGLGHAVLMAKNMIGDEPFAVLLGDDLVVNKVPAIKQLMDVSLANKGASVIGVMEVPKSDTSKYGIVKGDIVNEKTLRMSGMVEKPKPEEAPTNLATPGRYILTPEIFEILEKIPRGASNEYQLTDAINVLCSRKDVFAFRFEGERFDTGSINGYLDATIDFALKDPAMRDNLIASIKTRLTKYGITL